MDTWVIVLFASVAWALCGVVTYRWAEEYDDDARRHYGSGCMPPEAIRKIRRLKMSLLGPLGILLMILVVVDDR